MKNLLCRLTWLLAGGIAMVSAGPVVAQDYVDRYAITPHSKDVDFGVQPLSYPNGVIGAVMQRDRQLRAQLSKLGTPLAMRAFKRQSTELKPSHPL